ncbi:MAG: T9SS type A sorting domain-containing protein [Verrucomicrobia bacterium]|nr:T9SS type A sorting domain-containing protein [Verrucomicrobiota bacterium]
MRFFIIGIYLLCLSTMVAAQQLTPQTINTAGQSSSSGNILLESSVGGLAVNSFAGTTYLYTQDFLQPFAGITTTIPPVPSLVATMGIGIDNGGATFTNNGAATMLEFTVGEVASISLQQGSDLLTQGILQPYQNGTTLPVTNLSFVAQRINPQQVKLSWQTEQEFNNKGFYIERKKENEIQFSVIGFEASKVYGGNSSSGLYYERNDINDYEGKTYYRLRQEDLDGHTSYSAIRIANGSGEKIFTLKAWPIPAVKNFYVEVKGLTQPGVLHIFDMSGKLVQSAVISNQQQLQVSGLAPGTYVLQLAGVKVPVQKIVVQ